MPPRTPAPVVDHPDSTVWGWPTKSLEADRRALGSITSTRQTRFALPDDGHPMSRWRSMRPGSPAPSGGAVHLPPRGHDHRPRSRSGLLDHGDRPALPSRPGPSTSTGDQLDGIAFHVYAEATRPLGDRWRGQPRTRRPQGGPRWRQRRHEQHHESDVRLIQREQPARLQPSLALRSIRARARTTGRAACRRPPVLGGSSSSVNSARCTSTGLVWAL